SVAACQEVPGPPRGRRGLPPDGRGMTRPASAALVDAVRQLAESGSTDHVDALAAELDPDVLRDALTVLVRTYAAMRYEGVAFLPVDEGVTATDAVVMCHGLLQAADLQVFELGLW